MTVSAMPAKTGIFRPNTPLECVGETGSKTTRVALQVVRRRPCRAENRHRPVPEPRLARQPGKVVVSSVRQHILACQFRKTYQYSEKGMLGTTLKCLA
jgi:hypothetical protein